METTTGRLRMLTENETTPAGYVKVPTRYEKRAMKLIKEGKKVDFGGTDGLSRWGAKKHEADKKRKAKIAKVSRKRNRI